MFEVNYGKLQCVLIKDPKFAFVWVERPNSIVQLIIIIDFLARYAYHFGILFM